MKIAFKKFIIGGIDSMNELINTVNNEPVKVLDSREVAEMIGIRHADLIRTIDSYIKVISTDAKLRSLNYFIESSYIDKKGESRKRYDITKLGCEVVANKTTGKKGILFTAEYVKRFQEMENAITQPLTQLDILAANVQILQQQEKAILKLQESHNEIKEQQERQQSEIDTLNGVCVEGSKRDKLKHLINSMVNKMGIPYSMGWSLFRDAFNAAYHTNVKLLITNYVKKNNLKQKPSLPEYLEQTNRLDDALRVAEKLVGKTK